MYLPEIYCYVQHFRMVLIVLPEPRRSTAVLYRYFNVVANQGPLMVRF